MDVSERAEPMSLPCYCVWMTLSKQMAKAEWRCGDEEQ